MQCHGEVENVLVITDHFTKYTHKVCCCSTNEESNSTNDRSRIFDKFVVRNGLSACLHSDQGRNFESRVHKELCWICDIKKPLTAPYHLQGNGCTDRLNRALIFMLRTLVYMQTCCTHRNKNYSVVNVCGELQVSNNENVFKCPSPWSGKIPRNTQISDT